MSAALEHAGKKQVDVSRNLGIPATTINAWCKGGALNASADTLARVATFLGVDAVWLANGTGTMVPSQTEEGASILSELKALELSGELAIYGPVLEQALTVIRVLRATHKLPGDLI